MGVYRGNADIVMEGADVIVERLKTTPVALTELTREYHCAYSTMIRAIYTRLTKAEYRQLAKKRLGRSVATQFKKGMRSWNKGNKGIHMSPATEFKKGHLPENHKHVGSVAIHNDKCGKQFRWIKVSGVTNGKHKWIPYARYLWQEKHGEVPKGKFVCHANGDTLDDAIDNLIAVNRREAISLMKKNNPGHRKKAIRNYKKTRRRKRLERERQRRYELKIGLKQEKKKALEKRHREIAEAGKAKLIGRICSWYECKGCGYETKYLDPPCPKCGGIAFERIEQPIKLAQKKAEIDFLSRTGTY